jgi:hypothetical protein
VVAIIRTNALTSKRPALATNNVAVLIAIMLTGRLFLGELAPNHVRTPVAAAGNHVRVQSWKEYIWMTPDSHVAFGKSEHTALTFAGMPMVFLQLQEVVGK